MMAEKDQVCIEQVRRGKLLVEDLQEAEECIIRCVQQECYENEMILTEDRVKSVRKSSPLQKLNPILKCDLLCVGGHLKHMPHESEALKNPVILPKRHVVDIIISHYHMQSGHSGTEYVLSKIREKYWIIKGKESVRRVLSSCCLIADDIGERQINKIWRIYHKTESFQITLHSHLLVLIALDSLW